MADLGIARPQELLASLPGKLEAAPPAARVRQSAESRESLRREPEETGPAQETAIDIARRVERLNQEAKDYNLRFEVNESSGRIVIHLVDGESGEILRTVPPSAVLNLQEHLLGESGLLVDARS